MLFKCEPVEPLANSDFPFDKYELSTSSPLSKYILDRKEPNVCWQVCFAVRVEDRISFLGAEFSLLGG